MNPELQPHQYRMLRELDELNHRVGNLSDFIMSPQFATLEEVERLDLYEQYRVMSQYQTILMRRVDRMQNAQ